MKLPRPFARLWALAFSLALTAAVSAAELHVFGSGAFTAAYNALAPGYEQASHDTLVYAFGPSMGGGPDSIPSRLNRHEPADVVIMASTALDALVKAGKVLPGTRVDLALSSIGMAVKAGAPVPDISTPEAVKQAVLQAKSIAYSSSASGVYLMETLFPKWGIADQVRPKAQRIDGLVGPVIAKGDAELGFQQISELQPVKGITLIGPIPKEIQKITTFSAGVVATSTHPERAKALIAYLASPEVAATVKSTGLEIPSDSARQPH